ncbi:MAG: chitobiase/beta-hexosaminidase C-terminal domain-containing protein [Verrucomicrobia bacterium]|nr:chitobiase/beta-hexosaminidase C-terminal domain-containing protein [Verrucomicrobiota bacterium]
MKPLPLLALTALILLATPVAEAGSGYAVSADGVVDTRYELTSVPPTNGTISGIAVDGKYLTDTTATLTAVPAAGYAFTGWTGAASGTANSLSLLMDADKTIGATFTRQYTLTASAVSNGSISGIAADGKYLTGTTATLTAVPAADYVFTAWSGDASGTTNPLSLAMNSDKIIGATFTRQYTLTTITLSNGSITGIAAGGKYLTDTTATLTAVPAAGYAFTGWTGAATGTANPLSLLMDTDKTIGATFTRQYTLTLGAVSNGTISGIVAGGKYLTGTTATLTAVPAAGYLFTGWTGAASGTINPLSLLMNSDKTIGATYGGGIEVLVGGQPPTGSEVVGRGSLRVTMQTAFANGTILYTLDGSAPSLGSKLYSKPLTLDRSRMVRAVAYSSDFSSQMQSPPLAVVIVPVLTVTTAGGGGISVEPPEGAYSTNSMATLTATPAAGWTFLQWLGDASGTDPVTSVRMTRNKCVQAVFGTAVNTTTVGSGSIRQEPIAAFYPYGTRVRFSGLPASGNYLAFWANAVSSTNNPLDFLVTTPNPTVTAVFQPLGTGQFALALVAEGGGKVAATPSANKYSSGASVRLTAQPDVGQDFVGWSGDAAGSINPLTVAMNQSKAVTAVFTKRPGLRVGTPLEGLVEDGFRLTLTGEFGKQYEILGSADLVTWIQAGTLTNVYGTSQFTDGEATNQPRRFYRAAILNP